MKRFLLIRGTELIALLVLAAIPLVITNPFALGLLTLLAIYGILLIGLDVTVGYLGQVNLAQAAFLGIGAYTAGLLVTHRRLQHSVRPRLRLPDLLSGHRRPARIASLAS